MKVVVLGRDGVINQQRRDGAVTADNFEPVAGSVDAIARLAQAGFRVVIATNQQELSRGELDVEDLHDVHLKLLSLITETGGAIDGVYFAPTGNPDGHGKSQPKVALLEQVSERYRLPATELIVIGDSREDLEAAASVGARSVLVQTGDSEQAFAALKKFQGVTIYTDLAGAVDAIVERS